MSQANVRVANGAHIEIVHHRNIYDCDSVINVLTLLRKLGLQFLHGLRRFLHALVPRCSLLLQRLHLCSLRLFGKTAARILDRRVQDLPGIRHSEPHLVHVFVSWTGVYLIAQAL